MRFKLLLLLSVLSFTVSAQQSYTFYGEVKDRKDNSLLPGAIVKIVGKVSDKTASKERSQQTDHNGHFHFDKLFEPQYTVHVSLLGYEDFEKVIDVSTSRHLIIYLDASSTQLGEVTVHGLSQQQSSLNTQTVGKSFIFDNNSTNLAKTLSKLPGVSSMDIGAGFSKPVIRGMAFNRIAVVDKGISQQDQQWGADHGLEIDQFDIDEVVVHKGPMSLQFGSDAIGGAIEILSPRISIDNTYYGDVTLIGKSNNDLWGVSLMNALKYNRWFVRARYTRQEYGDYRVPADNVYYANTNLPIHNRRLKNTAGREENILGLVHYRGNGFENQLNVSNVYQKNGFFPGAHGIPSISRLDHDGSYRNIEMPYSNAGHFKVINNTTIRLATDLNLAVDLGYQNNRRQEWSAFHTHYSNQEKPLVDPDLELDFRLQTYSLNTKLLVGNPQDFSQTVGVQSNLQQNRIKGYSYLLPRFDQLAVGGYWLGNYQYNDQWKLSGGVRYDYGKIDVTGFYDPTLAEYLHNQGYSDNDAAQYAQRAYDVSPDYHNFSASLGAIYTPDRDQTWKINVGRSFRMPTANELASNGVHHGAFRHEQGNPDLKAEQGYQLDLDYSLHRHNWSLSLSPYVSYFSHYIFLEPAGDWSVLPHAGQIYKYRNAEAFFAGAEYRFNIGLFHLMEFSSSGQYVYNRNLTDKYPLPFTPPFSMRNELTYSGKWKAIKSYRISLEHQLFAGQNHIARNEDKTPGTNLFNFSVNTNWLVNKFRFSAGLQVQNIFNTRYLNHLSFYRKIKVPEAGRNIQLLIKIPFFTNF